MFHLCRHTGIHTVKYNFIFCSPNGADCEPVVVTMMQDLDEFVRHNFKSIGKATTRILEPISNRSFCTADTILSFSQAAGLRRISLSDCKRQQSSVWIQVSSVLACCPLLLSCKLSTSMGSLGGFFDTFCRSLNISSFAAVFWHPNCNFAGFHGVLVYCGCLASYSREEHVIDTIK